MKKISIIILNWNGRKMLETFLPSVIEHSPDEIADIIVADNGSTDDSITFLTNNYPAVKIIPLEKNYGFAGGYNKAMAEIKTPYSVLLNTDVEVTRQWLDAPLNLLDKNKEIACVQPKILSLKNRNYFEYAGAAGGYIDRYGYPFCRGRIFDKIEEDKGQYDDQTDIAWATGACLFIRTEVYINEGGLDEYFFAHQEEVDLCWRLGCRGFRIVYTPASHIFHKGGATLEVSNPHKTFLNFRNNLLMIYKNIPEKDLSRVLLVRKLFDLVAALKFILSGNIKDAKAIFRARSAFRSALGEYKAARNENRARTVVSPAPQIMQRCLLREFYFNKKKTFAELDAYRHKLKP
jgi:GT2 family glycosyltransferase